MLDTATNGCQVSSECGPRASRAARLPNWNFGMRRDRDPMRLRHSAGTSLGAGAPPERLARRTQAPTSASSDRTTERRVTEARARIPDAAFDLGLGPQDHHETAAGAPNHNVTRPPITTCA